MKKINNNKRQETNGKLFAFGQTCGKVSIALLGASVISFVAGTVCNLIIDKRERTDVKNRRINNHGK